MSQIVTLEKVSKIYQMDGVNNPVLKNISLAVKEGELLSIAGPSGSGKSTLMHIIGLLDQPTSGKVFINGQATDKLSENQLATLRNQGIGFVFQTFNLLPRTSALDNVLLPLSYSKQFRKNRRETARQVLSEVGLANRLDHHPSQLSGGEQQRVAIARALVCQPTIILADEPTGNLDSKSGNQILSLLKELNNKGKTVLIVTHDKKISQTTNRQISIEDGKILGDRSK